MQISQIRKQSFHIDHMNLTCVYTLHRLITSTKSDVMQIVSIIYTRSVPNLRIPVIALIIRYADD